jgi:hypothetical protein
MKPKFLVGRRSFIIETIEKTQPSSEPRPTYVSGTGSPGHWPGTTEVVRAVPTKQSSVSLQLSLQGSGSLEPYAACVSQWPELIHSVRSSVIPQTTISAAAVFQASSLVRVIWANPRPGNRLGTFSPKP